MFIGTTTDTTESKRAQEALRAVRSELERITRLTALAQMAASIAHEINQPLASIVSGGNAGLYWLAKTQQNLKLSKRWRASSRKSAFDGRGHAFRCVPTAASRVRNSWLGARPRA
jgi:signal transduction histidine kinase